MAQKLYQTFEVPEIINEEEQFDREYRRSMKWNPETGDFVRDGSNRVLDCDGREAFMIWCFKVAQTERYQCLAYPRSIGTEMEAVKDDDREVAQSMVERTITEALKVNPRTEYVRNFEFSWNGDELHCSCVVKGVNWGEFQISI